MIRPDSFLRHALELLDHYADGGADELILRRAVCASYYGLFHTLGDAAAGLVAPAEGAFRNNVRRTLNHGAMAKVCGVFAKARNTAFPEPLRAALPGRLPDELFDLAALFVELQEARHVADYDLSATFSFAEVSRLSVDAWNAGASLSSLRGDPAMAVFLAALLLPERRRG